MIMTNIALIILPHDNYGAFTSNNDISQAFNKSYLSLCNLVIPQQISLSVSFVCHTSTQDFFSDFIELLQTNKPEIKINTLVLDDHQRMLSDCLSVSLKLTQAEYVMFFAPGSKLQPDFFSALQPELKNHPLIIKSAVIHPEKYMLLDEQYCFLLERSTVFLCKDFGSMLIQREFLLNHNFLQTMHRFGVSDIGLCATLSEMLQTKAKQELLLATQHPEQHQVTLFENHKTSLQKLEAASDTLLTAAKNRPPLVYIPASKIALPLQNYSYPEQIKNAAQELLATYKIMAHMAVSYIGFTLISFLDKVMYCANSQLKLLTVQECLHIYQTFRQHAQDTKQDEKITEYLHKTMNELCKTSISDAFEQQDTVALLEVGFRRLLNGSQKSLKEHDSDHASYMLIESKFRELLRTSCGLPQNLSVPDNQYSVFESLSLTPVSTTHQHLDTAPAPQAQLNDKASHFKPDDSSYQHDEKPLHSQEEHCAAQPNENAAQANYQHNIKEPIYVVSAVNDPTLYRKLFIQNPMLNEPNVYLCPRLNPNPQQPDKVLGLSALYNQFIDEFDHYKQGWIVFCHNDFEIIERLTPVLSKLDPNYIYGPCGAFITQKKGRNFQAFVGYSIEQQPRKSLLNYTLKNSNFHRFPNNREKYVVDTLDCLCVIVHSSLIHRFNLRFDEHLRFDLVV